MYTSSTMPSAKRPRHGLPTSPSLDPNQSSNQSAVPGPTDTTRPVGLTAPHINPQLVRSGDMTRVGEEIREARHKDSFCRLCSSKRRAVHHPHFSTQEMREFALKFRTTGTFSCPICKQEEPAELPSNNTRRVVLSSSTLYNVWENHQLKVNHHFEMEAIVGGRVHDMTRALDKLYLDKPNRLEIIVVATINNIGDGQSADSIMEDIKYMKRLVAEHSELYKHDPPSWVSFATCLLPPKFTSFHVPPEAPNLAQWLPPATFVNYADTIEALNAMIINMNNQDGLRFVGMHLQGMKYFKSGTKQHKFDTLPGAKRIWREPQVFKKLHFTQEHKLKIIGYVMKCFEDNSKSVNSD